MNTIEQRTEEAIRFFSHLWPGKPKLAQAELHNRGKSNQSFTEGKRRFRAFGMSLEIHLEEVMTKAERGVEMFYCPTPMENESGRKKYQVLPSPVVFSDADFGLTPEAHTRLVTLGACLVRSGGKTDDGRHKYHIYLRLSRAVGLDELERINRGLKAYVNGDKFDATSLLRVPGTRNHKYPGRPLVTVERYASATHDPDFLAAEFPVPRDYVEGVALEGMKLPSIPDGFRFTAQETGYFRLRKVVREWNGRFAEGNISHRYGAAIAIVKEAVKHGISVDVAYAFANECEPLLDKQAEENGYDIRKDIAKTYYRETKTQSSGLTVEEFTREAEQKPAVKDSERPTPTKPMDSGPVDTSVFGAGFPFAIPSIDDLLSGDYKPLEPSLVQCGPYFLLYPGKSHGISSDRGLGKTHVTIAMVHDVMKKGGRVAYFDFEDTPDTFIRDRMMNQHGIPAEMIRNQFLYIAGIDISNEASEDEEISPSEAVKMLATYLTGWDLVVIDGVSASMAEWSVEDGAPPMLDGSKSTDYAWWYNRQVKPFLDAGIATFQIDHNTKTGSRVGGTIQKGAKLTGIEYELRADANGSLVMGGTGRLILAAVKDRIGRVLRYKKKNPGEDEYYDVARFVMTSDIDGHVTRAEFEPINQEQAGHDAEGNVQGPTLTENEQRVWDVLEAARGPMSKSAITKAAGMNNTNGKIAMESLIQRGLCEMVVEGTAHKLVPIRNAPVPAPRAGERELDFSKADRVPARAQSQRECRKCREMVNYPSEFAQPDDIGYQPKRPMCKPCASEAIDSERDWDRDGAERARTIRERLTGRRSTRNRRESS